MFWFLKRKKKTQQKVEREIWYEFVMQFRAWDSNWQTFLEDTSPKKPMSKDEFIDKMIKKYKLSEREQKKHT